MSVLFRKKPIPVEARQVGPSSDGQAGLDLAVWCGGSVSGTYDEPLILVPTLEGDLKARVGDWIVKGSRGEFWPVKGAIFAEDYEVIDDAAAALDGQAYDGELAMLRTLVRTLRVAARQSDLPAVQQALINHATDDAAARVRVGEPA